MKKNFNSCLAFFATAALLLAFPLPSFAQQNNQYQPLTFPDSLTRFDTEFFRLVNPESSIDPQTKKNYYDPALAKQFDAVIKQFSTLDKKLKQKLLSGPAAKGKYITVGTSTYIFYSACQAHACNTTDFVVLYQPEKQRLIGRLQYKCNVYPANNPTPQETSAINALSPIESANSFYQEACKYEKESHK